MTSINPINVNTQGVGSFGSAVPSKAEKKEEKAAEVQPEIKQSQVPADQVLNFLAASSTPVVARKTVDPSKYVDEASAARIGEFMKGFEDKVAEGLKAFDQEFAGVNVADSTKMAVVLKQIDKES